MQIIKDTSIDQVREADIYDIISHYTQLKKSGSSWVCNSPLINEKTPSFHVNPVKNNWVCYSSNQGGDGLKFVMIKDSLSFIEAVEKIASICNIILQYEELSPEQQNKHTNRQNALEVLKATADKYSQQYTNLSDVHWAKKMVLERKFSQESILNFKIGYAPGNRLVTAELIERALFEVGKSTGLVNVREDKSFDFFNDRLMFPILNERGEVVAFGGRAPQGVDPKYLNSKESPYYNKTKTVYGLYQARKAIAQTKIAVLTEGYTDVIACHQNEVCNAIATCGTALTPEQILLIKRYARTVVIMRDNDYPKAVKALIDLTASIATEKLIQFSDKFTGITEANCIDIARQVIKQLSADEDNKILIDQLDDRIRDINPQDLGPGTKAAFKDVDILLKYGLKVLICLLPIGEDPDSFSRTANLKKYIEDNSIDAFEWKATKIRNIAGNDPDAVSDAIRSVSEILYHINDDVKRGIYTDLAAKLFKQNKKVFADKMEQIKGEAEIKASESSNPTKEMMDELKLPEGTDYEDYKKYNFVWTDNCYYFQGRSGGFFRGTNFVIEPMFHIYGQLNNKRICEASFEGGRKKLVILESQDFVQKTRFETALINEGNLVFTENVSNGHFIMLRNKILSNFQKAYEITSLGWQPKEKIFAFADCILDRGVLKKVSDYGIIEINKEEYADDDKGEYFEEVNSYFLPAFSAIYKDLRDGDDPYENDRFFVYKKSPVPLQTWISQMIKVYGEEKAAIGVAFNIASLFRDIYLKRYQFFPHVFCTGDKGSGKSKFAESCVAMFTYKQEPFDLNSGTPVAFYRRLARINNAPTMLEEYHDNLDDKIFQSLKGAYDGRGREMGKATGDNRTVTTKVNSSLFILSQYLSSRDDNSLTSRSIILNFIKPINPFSVEEVREYDKLKAWEEVGLSSLLVDVIDHRQLVEEHIHKKYSEVISRFKRDLKGKDYQERTLQNYAALLAPMEVLTETGALHLVFDMNKVYRQYLEAILNTSDLIVESEGLAEYWSVLEFLRDSSRLNDQIHFNIKVEQDVAIAGRKGEADIIYSNTERKRLLFLNQKTVHQLYHKEISTRNNTQVITDSTLRNYFRSKRYFIGVKGKSHRYGQTATTAFVFDYDMMERGGVLNLSRYVSGDEFDNPFSDGNETGI
ncbi:DNA primase [Myroides odoratimimus]|uniref:DNA primase n=1 Tax=Myroides odoratimimus TaxID=76832 RepID=UPI0025763AB6|nr:DNA primase [Myroides odoratimimus]MDM1441888.1 DNA primase [Myroides odoratimimus]